MSHSRIAVVTGGNKGIGYAIVRHLALRYPSSQFNKGRLLIYLTARNKERGEEAVQSLYNDAQLQKAAALAAAGGLSDIKFHVMDVSDSKSIQDFGNFLGEQHSDGIDIAINNAGIALDGFNTEIVKETQKTNYHGTLEASQMFLQHIRPNGRLVNVASLTGKLLNYSKELQAAFTSASRQATPDASTELMDRFVADVAAGKSTERGWPMSAYGVSKAGCIAMTKALAHREQEKNRGVLVNAVCPGYIKTALTKGRGVKSTDEGAQLPVKLALDDIQGTTGEFWSRGSVVEWEH